MNRKFSKKVTSHPAVATVDFGPDSGVEDYKYDIWLQDGYRFTSGKSEGCQGGHFTSAQDFLYARPMPLQHPAFEGKK